MRSCCRSVTDFLFFSFGSPPKTRNNCRFYLVTHLPFFSIYAHYQLYKGSTSVKITAAILLRGFLSVISLGLLVLILDIIFGVAKLICNCCCKPKGKGRGQIFKEKDRTSTDLFIERSDDIRAEDKPSVEGYEESFNIF